MDEFDDDFGDLYADVEVQASSAINATVSMKNSVCDDVGGDEEEEDAGTTGGGDEEEDESDDDSEDDLNIVLNSDDDAGNGNGTGPLVVNLVEAEDEEEEERENAGGNGFTALEGNGLDGNCEKVGGCCGERAKGGCHNQYSKYKYIRFQPAALGNKGKENGCATLSSYPCLSARADREDNGCGQRMGSSSITAHSGHNFSLPRSRTILDVNIDIFERKPWRHAGADVTDFFNFGFDEISWKHYCNQLDIYRHKAAKPTNFRPPESFKSTEAFEAEHKSIAHIAAGRKGQSKCGRAASSMHSGEEQSEMKGRAIQVEDSIVERQPSMDLRRPPDRDSDVIQIMVQDTRENSSCTAKLGSSHDDKSLDKGSQNEDNCLDASGEFLCFSSASEDELNSESLDGHHEEVDIAVSKRSSTQTTVCHKSMDSNNHGNLQISDVDMRKNQIVAICSSEGTDEEIETPNHATKRVGGDACTTDPSIMEEESSQGEKSQYSPRSSCCEAVEVGAYIDMRESHNHRIRRPTRKSSSEFRKPVKSKRSDGKTKPTSGRHDKRYRSPLYHSNGFNGMPKSNAHFDNKNTRSFLDAEGPYDVHLSTIGHSRSKERLSPFDSYYDGKKLSYDRESELSFDFIRERFSDYEDGYEHMKYPYRKVYRRFEEETGQCIYRTSDDRGFFLDERPSVIDEDVWDWYHYETSLAVDDGGLLTNQESGQYFEDSFYLDDERGIRRKRKGDELDFRSRGEYDEVFNESKYSYDLQRERYKRSCKYDGRDSSSLEYNYDRPIPYSRREAKSPRRNKRFGSQSAGLDTYYSGDEDIYMGCRDDPSFSSRSFLEPRPSRSRRWRDTMIPKSTDCDRQGKYRKQWSERVRDNGSHGDCYNASFTEVSINNSDDYVHFGRKKPHSKYDRLRRNEEKFISRAQDDKFQVEGAPFSFERTPRCKRFDAEHGLYHVEELLEDRQAEGCRYEQRIKGSNGNQFDTPPTIRSHEQTFLNYKDSIDSDLFVGEGKIELKNPCREGKKLLVLDIDYTLFDHRSTAENPLQLMRPYLHEFLSAVYAEYDIVIWSATSMKWVELKMEQLGVLDNPNYKITALLDHLAMITVQSDSRGIFDCKPLGLIWAHFPQFYNSKNTIMFDDLRRNFVMNPQNGLTIKPFRKAHANRDSDRELVKLTQYLLAIADLDDISILDHKHWETYSEANSKRRRHT